MNPSEREAIRNWAYCKKLEKLTKTTMKCNWYEPVDPWCWRCDAPLQGEMALVIEAPGVVLAGCPACRARQVAGYATAFAEYDPRQAIDLLMGRR